MLDETGLVHGIGIIVQLVAVDIDLDQVGRLDLAEQKAERIDEEGIGLARHFYGDVVVDRFGPPHHVEDTVACGQLLTDFPFLLTHVCAVRAGV